MPKKKTKGRDNLVNKVFSTIVKGLDGEDVSTDTENLTAKDVLGAFANWGGKGKDEIVQILCREIGVATAAVLKEPLNQVIENRKLQITMELVPKDSGQVSSKPAKKKSVKKRSKRS